MVKHIKYRDFQKNGETRADSILNDDIQMIIDNEDAQRVSQAIRAEAEIQKKLKKMVLKLMQNNKMHK